MSANLILHWMLDQLDEGNSIPDETDNHLNGTYAGNIQAVPDAKFGSCLYFDGNGDSITIPDNAALRLHNYTAEVWIKPEQTNNWQGVLGKPGRNYSIWLGTSGYVNHRFHAEDNLDAGTLNTANDSIVWGQWHHVAITNDGQTARTYINGILKAEGAVNGNLVIDNTQLIVGRSLDDRQDSYYKGCMAHLRLYDDVLTLEEIQRDMLQDESATSAFVRSHPIDFELYNEDNHHVLFIDDHPQGQTLSLDILNSSRQNIELNDIGQTATPQVHHFELRFRPETLARANLAQIKVATDGWSLDRAPDGTALYLLHQGSTTLEAGKTISLQLTGMNADGRGGTRGTRVELVYKNMHYAGEESLLDDSRLQYLNLVNRQGRRNIPLHVGFVGSDTVLSDGKTLNTLRLRIANLSRDFGLRLSKGDPTTPDSRFRISFDVQGTGETREWALANQTTAGNVSIKVKEFRKIDKGKWISSEWPQPINTSNNESQTVEWTVAPSEDTTLEADGYIILELSKLVALPSIGHANIYINFENIPGYQDEQVTIVVQKSPLLFSNGNVGIGTNSPGAKLQIIHANQDAYGDTLILGPTDQSNLRLGYHQDYSWIQSHGSKPLAINPIGNNVGIGIKEPGSYRLNVEGGNTRLGGSLHFSANQEIVFTKNGQIRSTDNNHWILFRSENKMELREHGDLIFSPGATSGAETAKVVISASGNVEIRGTGRLGIGSSDFTKEPLVIRAQQRQESLIAFEDPEGNKKWHIEQNFGGNTPGLNFVETGIADFRLFLQKGGNVGIGFSNPRAKLDVYGDLALSSSNNKFKMYLDPGGKKLIFEIENATHGTNKKMSWDGDNNWDSESDIISKIDIENEENLLSRLMQLDVKNYRWKGDKKSNSKTIGFIAQDVRPLFPALVGELKGNDDFQPKLTLKYAQFGVLAVGGLKELKLQKDAEIAELRSRFESEIEALKAQIRQLSQRK